MMLQKMLTVRSSSSSKGVILVLLSEKVFKKGLKHIFVLRRFKYSVIVYQCSLGELWHEG